MPIGPLDRASHETLLRIIPTALAVLYVAVQIEPSSERVLEWYLYTPIAELGYLTAEQLVSMGRASVVIEFLQSVSRGERDHLA